MAFDQKAQKTRKNKAKDQTIRSQYSTDRTDRKLSSDNNYCLEFEAPKNGIDSKIRSLSQNNKKLKKRLNKEVSKLKSHKKSRSQSKSQRLTN